MTIAKPVDDDGGGSSQADKQEHDKILMTATDEQHKISRKLCEKPPDTGKELKADIRQCEGKQKATLQKVDNESKETSMFAKFTVKKLPEDVENDCKKTVQVSDHSADGASHGKMKSDQKYIPTSKFTGFMVKKLLEDEDSRTQRLGEGGSKVGLLSDLPKTHPVDSKKQIILDDDSTTSKSKSKAAQDTPKRTNEIVDKELQFPYKEKLDKSLEDVVVFYPQSDAPGVIDVRYKDMACLKPRAELTGTILSFYIQYLKQTTSSSESATSHYHLFGTYFYDKLKTEMDFHKLRRWWKDVNILEKSFIVVPICEKTHWSLVIACLLPEADKTGPTLLHFDSYPGIHDSASIFGEIKKFLEAEWRCLRNSATTLDLPMAQIWENLDSNMILRIPKVPWQTNTYDRGLFVLSYLERFIKEVPERLRARDISRFENQWFSSGEASDLREKIFVLLVQEFKKAKNAKENESTSSPKF